MPPPAPHEKNAELAALFSDFADLLEVRGESPFKVNAYRRAASGLLTTQHDVRRLAAEDRLREVPGVGQAIERKIREYLATGQVRRYEEARAVVPEGVKQMLRLPGVGARAIARIVAALGIEDLDGLEQAARDGRLSEVRGLGKAKADAILRAIAQIRR